MQMFYLKPLEIGLNNLIAADPEIIPLIQELNSKTIKLQWAGIMTLAYLKFIAPEAKKYVKLSPHAEKYDLEINFKSSAVLGLNQDLMQLIRRGDLTLSGDLELGRRVQKIWKMFSPNTKICLQSLCGENLAYFFSLATKNVAQEVTRIKQDFDKNVTEYLQEELKQLPTRIEVEEFLTQVDELRLQFDRLAMRIKKLS